MFLNHSLTIQLKKVFMKKEKKKKQLGYVLIFFYLTCMWNLFLLAFSFPWLSYPKPHEIYRPKLSRGLFSSIFMEYY